MKTRYLALAAFALTLGSAACGSDDDTSGPGDIQSLSVLIDGGPFAAVNGGAVRTGNTVTLTGIATSGGTVVQTITISFAASANGTLEVGAVGGPSIVYSVQPSGGPVAQWAAGEGAGSGTIVLTQLSATKAVGTFLANLPPVTATGATNAKVLTQGSFNLLF